MILTKDYDYDLPEELIAQTPLKDRVASRLMVLDREKHSIEHKVFKNIISTAKVKVGCFDTRFYGFTEIKDVSDIDSIKFEGGGGTNFDAAVNAFTDRVDNKIIFTDGYGLMPIKPVDAIWIVFGDAIINPPGGRVIHIDDEQLDRLEQRDMVPQHRRIR